MAGFRVVLIEHGYGTSRYEREIIEAAGGEFVDAQDRSLDEALELCRDAEGIMLRRIQVSPEMIRRFERCRTICRYGVGTDNVDREAATAAGIIVANVPDYCIDEVSTHAMALLLACVRNVASTHEAMRRGGWDIPRAAAVHRLSGRTLGIVGLGQIGSAVARKLGGWGLRLLATDPFAEPERAATLGVELVELEELCRESDYLSVHVPLLPETHHLIGPRQLGLLAAGAMLVNTSRGPVVDTEALLESLDGGQLAAAALDVFEEEPLPHDSPLRAHPRVTLTDHTAWHSEESQVELQTSAARAVATVCTGGLPASVGNPEVIERLGRLDEWEPAECMQWRLKRMGLPMGGET
ncbi:MAG: C-terminal binding protein [Candidatus Brocadiia bacterium]